MARQKDELVAQFRGLSITRRNLNTALYQRSCEIGLNRHRGLRADRDVGLARHKKNLPASGGDSRARNKT